MGSHRKPKFKLGPPPTVKDLTFWQFHYRENLLDTDALKEQFHRARSRSARDAMWAGVNALEERAWTIVHHAHRAGELLTVFMPEGA